MWCQPLRNLRWDMAFVEKNVFLEKCGQTDRKPTWICVFPAQTPNKLIWTNWNWSRFLERFCVWLLIWQIVHILEITRSPDWVCAIESIAHAHTRRSRGSSLMTQPENWLAKSICCLFFPSDDKTQEKNRRKCRSLGKSLDPSRCLVCFIRFQPGFVILWLSSLFCRCFCFSRLLVGLPGCSVQFVLVLSCFFFFLKWTTTGNIR